MYEAYEGSLMWVVGKTGEEAIATAKNQQDAQKIADALNRETVYIYNNDEEIYQSDELPKFQDIESECIIRIDAEGNLDWSEGCGWMSIGKEQA